MNAPKQTFRTPTNAVLHSSPAYDKIKATQNWLVCPVCQKQKLARLLPTTEVKDLALHCKRCNREVIVNNLSEPAP